MSEKVVTTESEAAPTEEQVKTFAIVMGICWFVFLLCLGAYYLGSKNYDADHQPEFSFVSPTPYYTYAWPTSAPTATPVWSLYTSPAYDFSMQFPSGWEIQQSGDNVVSMYNGYRSGGVGGVWVTIFINSLADYPLSEPTFNSYYASPPGPITTTPGRTALKLENVTVSGYKAVKFSEYTDENDTVMYYLNYDFLKGDHHYQVVFSTGSRQLEQQYMPYYDQMINSFHFAR